MSKDTDQISEHKLTEKARASVRDVQLPDDVQRKLRLARAEAVGQLDEAGDKPVFGGARWLLPTAAAATVMVGVMLTWNSPPETMPMLDEQELAAAMDMEMLDDIEFLAWMLEENSDEVFPDDG